MALGHRSGRGQGGRGGRPPAGTARRAGPPHRGAGTGPAASGRLERDHRGGPARRRRGHPRRGPHPHHGRTGPCPPGGPQPFPALLRPRPQGVRTDRHPPGGHRAGARHARRAQRGHRRLAPLAGGLPARRRPGAGRGAVHRGGAAGRGRAVDAGVLPRRPRGVRGVGRPAERHRPPRAARARGGPVHGHVAEHRLSRHRGGPHRPRRLPLLPPAVPVPLPHDVAARRALRPPVVGLSAADRGGPHHGGLDGGLHLPGRLHAGRALRPDDRGPDARPGPVPGRRRRDPAAADRRTAAHHAARARPADDPRDGPRRPLRPHRRRPPGRRRLVRHDPAARRPLRPGHRRRPGARRAGRRADGPTAHRPARLRLRGPPPGRGALPAPRTSSTASPSPTTTRGTCASRPATTPRSTPRPAPWRAPAPGTWTRWCG